MKTIRFEDCMMHSSGRFADGCRKAFEILAEKGKVMENMVLGLSQLTASLSTQIADKKRSFDEYRTRTEEQFRDWDARYAQSKSTFRGKVAQIRGVSNSISSKQGDRQEDEIKDTRHE